MESGPERDKLDMHVERAALHAGGLLRSRYGLWALAGISFIESALLIPILTDPFIVVYILANREKAVRGIVVTTVFSALGGVFAYALAASFFELLVSPYLSTEAMAQFLSIAERFRENTFVLSFLGALTPLPYTLVALAAGFVEGSIIAFVIASLIGRGIRYGIIGWLTYRFGEGALLVIRRRLLLFSLLAVAGACLYLVLHGW